MREDFALEVDGEEGDFFRVGEYFPGGDDVLDNLINDLNRRCEDPSEGVGDDGGDVDAEAEVEVEDGESIHWCWF